MKKINLYDLTLPEIEKLLAQWKQPRYRARQIWTWLYAQLATDFSQMSSLPKSLRQQLATKTELYIPTVLAQQSSMSGQTRKDLLKMRNGAEVEVVLMRYIDRRSVCISTQVGCAMDCKFCATGQMGFKRNLTSGEIVAQVLHFQRELAPQEQRLSNIVFMGMGEPFLNYNNTLAAVRRLMHPDGLNFGQRRMTLSTVGIVPGIRRFTAEELQLNLAISLHAATDKLRSRLMPINKRYNLNALFMAVSDYIERTNRRVTFEWSLINGVNDTPEQAAALAARLEGMLAHVNLIPLNPTAGYSRQPSTPERVEAFGVFLERHHISHTTRLGRGLGIRAGCGQLRRRIRQS